MSATTAIARSRARRPALRPIGVGAALALGLTTSAVAVAIVLSGAPGVVSASNEVPLALRFAQTHGPAMLCQPGESLQAGVSAIRPSLEASIGPKVALGVFSGGRLIAYGTRGAGWTGGSVTVPVKPLPHAVAHVTVCVAFARSGVHLAALGAPAGPLRSARFVRGRPLRARMRIDYLRAGTASWWSLAPSVARRMGLGRSLSGTWIPLLALALMLALVAVVCGVSLRELSSGSRAPALATAWLCALVAGLNAACWSLITPPFEVPDETGHYAYVQVLAENHTLPSSGLAWESPALTMTELDLHSAEVAFNPGHRSLASEAQQRKLERDQAAQLSRRGPGGAAEATSEPPLYYALELIPYELGSSGTLLNRLALMRLLSVAMGALTALFAYLFVREALPALRWAWTAGGLAVALFPLLGFMSGGVNPDAMLFAVCAALYYCLARAFRRGLSARLALALGALTAVGFLTKLNFVGFAPAVLLGLALLGARARRPSPRWLAAAAALAVGPVLLYGVVNAGSDHHTLGAASQTLAVVHGSLFHQLSYVWQFYLPRLPGMPDYFPGISSTSRQLWLDGLIGHYGWSDTLFPGWVYDAALIGFAAIALLCARELVRRRAALHDRLTELGVYALTGAGVMAVVGLQSYASVVEQGFEPFAEPRYLLPMLALWGCVVALAARGAGRRWGPTIGALLVTLTLAHDLFSQLQVIARYYG